MPTSRSRSAEPNDRSAREFRHREGGDRVNPVIEMMDRRLRLAVIGGGPGSFIGAVHRTAARIDDRYELVAAALSSDA